MLRRSGINFHSRLILTLLNYLIQRNVYMVCSSDALISMKAGLTQLPADIQAN